MSKRWILVADASRARLFREYGTAHEIELLETLEHPDSRARVRDLMADANGRKPVGAPLGGAYGGRAVSHSFGRIGAAPDTDPKEVEAQKFAHTLAEMLESKLNEHAYEKVVLVAPPHFLGLLKGTVSGEVSKRIEVSLNKDLTKHELRDIQDYIKGQIAPSLWPRALDSRTGTARRGC